MMCEAADTMLSRPNEEGWLFACTKQSSDVEFFKIEGSLFLYVPPHPRFKLSLLTSFQSLIFAINSKGARKPSLLESYVKEKKGKLK